MEAKGATEPASLALEDPPEFRDGAPPPPPEVVKQEQEGTSSPAKVGEDTFRAAQLPPPGGLGESPRVIHRGGDGGGGDEDEGGLPPVIETGEEIVVTDQDVLFGRGGLTNRHIGNLRYRDIISIHRQDYVHAAKTEKPNVARRIVKAIRTGKSPGRFLKRGDDGKWVVVSDQEASWKASQALREKTRWSSMKPGGAEYVPLEERGGSSSASPRKEAAATTAMPPLLGSPSPIKGIKSSPTPKKRKASSEKQQSESGKQMRVTVPADEPQSKPKERSAIAKTSPEMPTRASEIAIPGMDLGDNVLVGSGAGGRPGAPHITGDVFPRDEDVLFGRGGRTNHHPGNKRLRQVVMKYRDTYNAAKKQDKPKVSKLIVSALRCADPPSRFLRMNESNTKWVDVGDKRAAEKVSQTLREKDKAEKRGKGGAGGGAETAVYDRKSIDRVAIEASAASAVPGGQPVGDTVAAQLPTLPKNEPLPLLQDPLSPPKKAGGTSEEVEI